MIDFNKFGLDDASDETKDALLKEVIKGALTGKEVPDFLQMRPRGGGSRIASLVFTAAKEIIASKAPLRVTPATDDDIVCALKTERPLVIKSEQDSIRVRKCMSLIMDERWNARPKPKRERRGIEQIPTWSLPYLVNGDSTGLTDEEVKMIKKAMDDHGILEVLSKTNDDASPYFTTCPLFGKPTEVEDWVVVYR